MPADLVLGEGLLPGLQPALPAISSHGGEGVLLSLSLFIRALILPQGLTPVT